MYFFVSVDVGDDRREVRKDLFCVQGEHLWYLTYLRRHKIGSRRDNLCNLDI